MAEVFLELWFEGNSLGDAGYGRSEIEDQLEAALSKAGIGEVTGGGGGIRGSNVDIELHDEQHFEEGLALIRKVLRRLKVPANTVVTRYEPTEVTYSVYD